MEVSNDSFDIRFYSRFIVKKAHIGDGCVCLDDCGGAGYLEYETGELKEGTYIIRLGQKEIGELLIPFIKDLVCLDSETVETPVYPAPAYPPPPENELLPTQYPYP